MDLSEPADDEELLLLGPVHEPWVCKTFRERQNNIADTVERVAAGQVEFVTEEMVLGEGKGNYSSGNLISTRFCSISKNNSVAKKMMSKLYDRVRRRKEGGVDDITRRNFQRTVRHMQRFIISEEEKIKGGHKLTLNGDDYNETIEVTNYLDKDEGIHTQLEESFDADLQENFNVFERQMYSQALSSSGFPSFADIASRSVIAENIEEERLQENGLSRQPPLDVLRETPPPAQEASPGMKGVRKRGRPAKGLSRQSPLDVLRETPPPAQEASAGMKGVRKRLGKSAKM